MIYLSFVERVDDPAEFLRAPLGRCFVAERFMAWCHSTTLCGSTIWGCPSEADVPMAAQMCELIVHPSLAPSCDVLMDYGGIERLDSDVLIAFSERVRDRLSVYAARIERTVVILPEGVSALFIAGAAPTLTPQFFDLLRVPIRFCAEPQQATDCLGEAAREALDETRRIRANRDEMALLDRVRAELMHNLTSASLESLARALGTSTRSLQRELSELGSSFSDELRRARVSKAMELLLHTDGKIESIAIRLGFGSASRMKTAFVRELGATPSDVRARRD